MQYKCQDPGKGFKMLEFGATLAGMQDEVMMAGEQPWDTQEASSPVKVFVWLHGLDNGIESHTS